ncbi:predicted protein [Naegleria gruberi]|uniref:Predicted protein n=1 Tax=Naegleria gruberi TaxID=5762 RepID=D2VAE8_NAEGR|nr:uncharacterized protein NAEGRDRAFT_79209 [Naegleria gruberi]EFC46416.1 predicted protein [Naegleria gruberi]|eukprot:XP_002679160.1 predicted protein [Naegleria gruberi strain NEG-M]
MQNSSPQDSEQQNGVQSHQQQEYSKVEEIVASNGSEHHQFYHEFRLDLIDHFLGVPHDVWVEHLFGYFTTNQLLRIRLVSKNLSDLVWYYFVNMKTKYSIRVGTTNTKFEKIVDHFLVHLPKLKKIDFQDFDLISTLSLTDVGLSHLSKLQTLEEVELFALDEAHGSYLKEWVKNNSKLLETITSLKISNTLLEHLPLLKHFKNLKILSLGRDADELDVNDQDMKQASIELPPTLEELEIYYPVVYRNVKSIVNQCPNLVKFYVGGDNLQDKPVEMMLKSLKKLQDFKLVVCPNYDDEDEDMDEEMTLIQGGFYTIFKTETLRNIRSLNIPYVLSTEAHIVNAQKSISTLAPYLEKLCLKFIPRFEGSKFTFDGVLNTLSTLTKLNSLTLKFQLYAFFLKASKTSLESLNTTMKNSLKYLKIKSGLYVKGPFSEIINALVGPSLETLILDILEEPNLDFSFLRKSPNLINLFVKGDENTNEALVKVFKPLHETLKKSNVKMNFPLSKVEGNGIGGSLAQYLPKENITKLNLYGIKKSHIPFLREFKNLKSLECSAFEEEVTDFTDFILPTSLKKLMFTGTQHLTGLEPGFISNILSLSRLRELFFVGSDLSDKFIEQLLPLNEKELICLYLEHINTITNNCLPYLGKLTNCDLIVVQYCENILFSKEFSIFQQEHPFVTIVVDEPENEEMEIDEQYEEFKSYHGWIYGDNNYHAVEDYVNILLESREMTLANFALDLYLSKNPYIHDPKSEPLPQEKIYDFCYKYILTFPSGCGGSTGICNIFELLDHIMRDHREIVTDERKKKLAKAIGKSLEFVTSCRCFTIASMILFNLGEIRYTINGLFKLDEFTGDESIDPLIEQIIQHILDNYGIIENYPVFYIMQMADILTRGYPHISKVLDFIHYLMNQDILKNHVPTLHALDNFAKTLNPGDDYISKLSIESYEGKDPLECIHERIPQSYKDSSIHITTVKIPKSGSRTRHYESEPFEAYGYRWIIDFCPKDKDDENDDEHTSSIYLTLDSTKSPLQHDKFDHIKLQYMMCNYDFNPITYLVYVKKFKMLGGSYGEYVDATQFHPFETNDEFDIYKFVVCLKLLEIPEYKTETTVQKIEQIHQGEKELSSRHYAPWIFRTFDELPTSIHTVSILSTSEENGDDCYSDIINAFGFKWCVCFYPKGETKMLVDDQSDKCAIFLTLCSFDKNEEKHALEKVEIKFMFANADFDSDSMYIGRSTLNGLRSAGNSLKRRDLYAPTMCTINGKTYFKYVVNVAIGLVAWSRNSNSENDDDFEDIEEQ